MDTNDLKIGIMKRVLVRIVEGSLDDLCEAATAAEVALEMIEMIEKQEEKQEWE
jgi:hypothetical protein